MSSFIQPVFIFILLDPSNVCQTLIEVLLRIERNNPTIPKPSMIPDHPRPVNTHFTQPLFVVCVAGTLILNCGNFGVQKKRSRKSRWSRGSWVEGVLEQPVFYSSENQSHKT